MGIRMGEQSDFGGVAFVKFSHSADVYVKHRIAENKEKVI